MIKKIDKKISIIVPCYNEEANLPLLFKRIEDSGKGWPVDWEVICIDDGSNDRTWEILCSEHSKNPRWRAISFSRNFGHQAAISAGIFYAEGDAVVTIDADLQDPPCEINNFITKWNEGFDIVYGVRQKRKEGALKRAAYWSFYRIMSKIVDFKFPLDSGDFCLMDRKIVNILKSMPERNRFIRGLRAWTGFRQIGIKYERQARAAGEAGYNFQKLLKLALDGIFCFSTIPLSIASYLGFWITLLSFFGVLFTFAQRIFRSFFESIGLGPVPGFATIVISILFLGGVQLIFLGIIGQYLGRIYDEVKERPHWIIKDSAGILQE